MDQNRFVGRTAVTSRDAAAFLVLVAVSAAVGWTVNLCRDRPLPWRYQSPSDRLAAGVARTEKSDDHRSPLQAQSDVSLEELKLLLRQPDTLILDARPSLFYETGHVPGALNLSRKDFERDFKQIQPRLQNPKIKMWIVYCSEPGCEDSQIVAQALARLGFGSIRIFKGGWEAWEKAGMEVEKVK